MWTDSIVYVIVAVVTALVGWRAYRLFTGRQRGCGGCSGCGGGNGSNETGGAQLRPLSGSGCGCGCGH